MRNVIIAGACFVALAATACRSERKVDTSQTTTTGADIQTERPAGIDIEPQGAAVPMNAPAPAATSDIQLDQPTDENAQRATAVPNDDGTAKSSGAMPNANAPDNSRSGTAIDPRDETLNPRRGNSFESSGGTSGLGVYPTSPQGNRDAGK